MKRSKFSRRAAIGNAGALLASAAAAPAAPAQTALRKHKANNAALARTADGHWTRLRRVVTTQDANGKGILLHDGEPTNVLELNGTRITRLWETAQVPVLLPLTDDAGATAGNAYRTGFKGSSFYVAELPGGSSAPNIPMHKNATVDYMAILSGRIIYRIEGRDIELGHGDTIVQGGNLHTWINRWKEPCLLLFVVLTGSATATS